MFDISSFSAFTMEVTEEVNQPNFVFKTECGEIRFSPNKGYFIFYNPKTVQRPEDEKDRCETIVFMNALRNLVEYLEEAKTVAREYDTMCVVAEPMEREQLINLEGEIYSKVLSCFEGNAKVRAIQHTLMVSVFNGKAYIWLKRFFRDGEEWKACRGGYPFGQEDNGALIGDFAEQCIEYADAKKKFMKSQLELISARLMKPSTDNVRAIL